MRSDFPRAFSVYGSAMGRSESYPDIRPRGRLRVYRVPINSQGYDPGGAYWGTGQPIYCVENTPISPFYTETGFVHYFRADSRAHAYRMSYGLYKDGRTPYGWDVPSFRLQSTRIH